MSGHINQEGYWPEGHSQQQGAAYFEVPAQQDFGQELNFQTFDSAAQQQVPYSPVYNANPYLNPEPSFMEPDPYAFGGQGMNTGPTQTGGEFDDEPPLLEELGINPEFIVQKTLTVLNPLRNPEAAAAQDTDFAGPLVFCLAFGAFLLLSGKVHFSYIYGFGVFGALGMWALLTLMSTNGVPFGTVVTVLGYCILPMVALSGINIVLSLQGYIGTVLTAVAILWCSLSASKLFVTALQMDHQQPLVMYPCALLYGVFALITVF